MLSILLISFLFAFLKSHQVRYAWLVNFASVDLVVGVADQDNTKVRQATELYQQAIELAPDRLNNVLLHLGHARVFLGDMYAGRLILLNIPSVAHFRMGSVILGDGLARQGDIEDAVTLWMNARVTMPVVDLIFQLIDQGEREQAANMSYELFLLWQIMNDAGELVPSRRIRERTSSNLTQWFTDQGDYQSAREIYSILLELGSDHPSYYRAIGRTYMQEGDYQQATDWFDEAIRRGPDNFNNYHERADLAIRTLEYQEAIYYFSEAFYFAPPQYKAGFAARIASLHQDLTHFTDAIQWFTIAVNLEPEQIEYRIALAGLLETVQQYDAAIEQYQVISSLDPDNQLAIESLKRLQK